MTTLSELLPKQSETVSAIYAHYKKTGDSEPTRGYLGASSIGHHCTRFLWYQFRYCCKPEFSGRMYRLFDTGNREEYRLVNDLRSVGCEVHPYDSVTGKQFVVSAFGGHFSGHLDGCVLGILEAPKTWHVFEGKTHNAKSFTKLIKEGVEKTKPQHYAQCQCYMHLTGMTRTLYLAVNKDTDELYSERIHYDPAVCACLLECAGRIITSTTPPERIATRPDFYQCKWCDARVICWGIQEEGKYQALPVPAISCRQCCHATPMMDGDARWVCEKHKRGLSEVDQEKACDDHLCLPGLFAFAEPTGYNNNWIEFTNEADGKKWLHGNTQVSFSTKELMQLSQQQLGIGMITDTKNLYQAEVTGVCHNDILLRYPDSDCEVIWSGRASELIEIWKRKFDEDLISLLPIATSDNFDVKVAEYEGGRVAVYYENCKQAEIRKGKE